MMWDTFDAKYLTFDITWAYIGPCDTQLPGGSVQQLSGAEIRYVVTGLLPGSQYNVTLAGSYNNIIMQGIIEAYAVLETLPPAGKSVFILRTPCLQGT